MLANSLMKTGDRDMVNGDRIIPETHRPASLGKTESSKFGEKPCLKN